MQHKSIIQLVLLFMAGALAAGAQPVVTKGAASFTEACGAWKTVTDIVVTEGAANDFAASQTNLTYVLGAPTGFEFKPGVGSVSKANGRDVSSVSINVTSGQITVTITTDGTPTKTDVVTISGVEMMITTATVAGSPYHVTYDAGSSSGSWNTVDGTQHADLTVSAGGTNITSNGTGGGNWNTASTWSPTQVPTECDNVTIIGSDVVTVDADVSVSDLTIGASATLTHGNNNQIDLYGSYTNNGSHLGGNGSSRLYLDGNAVAIDGTGSIGVGGGIYVEGNYDIAATAALSASKTITIDGANTVTNNGSVTTTATITGTGTWINAANATLITTSTITSGLTANAAGNLVHYNNGGNQNIKAASYANITFSGSGNKTLQGNIVVGEDLTLNSGPTLATSSYHISLAGDWINNGGNVNHSNTCILTLNGASDQKITSAGKAFYDIVVNNTGAAGSDDILPQDALTANGSVTLTDGDLNANGFNISVGKNWTVGASGSFTHGNANTVTFNGTAVQTITSNGNSFYLFTTNNTAGAASDDIILADDLTVLSTLTVTDGEFKPSGNTAYVAGDWTIGATGSFTHGGSGTVVLNGGVAQAITSNAQPFYNLTISNSSGDVSLSDNTTVANALTFSSGFISIGDFDLTTTTISGASSSNFVVTDGIGELVKPSLNSAFTFPIGTTTSSYTPVTIDNTAGAAGDFGTRVCENVFDDGACSGGTQITSMVINKTWQVSTTSGSPNYNITTQWNASDETGDFDRSKTYISMYTGGAWDQQNAEGAAGGSDPYTVTATAMTAAGPIGVGGGAFGALPIELLSFEAKTGEGCVDLEWVTASETNNDYFTIEKSSDGKEFAEIKTVKGAGNSVAMLHYYAKDEKPLDGISYYRLKQTDFDGAFTYSQVVAVRYDASVMSTGRKDEPSIGVYPNPTTGKEVSIKLSKFNKDEEVLVVIMDETGREYYSKVILTNTGGDTVLAVDPYRRLVPGLYLVIASSRQSIVSQKLVIKP